MGERVVRTKRGVEKGIGKGLEKALEKPLGKIVTGPTFSNVSNGVSEVFQLPDFRCYWDLRGFFLPEGLCEAVEK